MSGAIDLLPSTIGQRRLYHLDRLDPGSPTYNVAVMVLRVRGALALPALHWAIDHLVGRHEAMRTTFDVIEGSVAQLVHEQMPTIRDVVELRRHPDVDQAVDLAEEVLYHRFDVVRGPLVRDLVVKLADDDHILAISVHHLVCDGWSVGIARRELTALYRSALGWDEASTPRLPIQYGDYAAWQNAQADSQAAQARLRWWAGYLRDSPVLDLVDRTRRPQTRSYVGATVPVRIAPSLTRAVERLGRAEGATPFMVLLAAYATLLATMSGQREVVIGTFIAGRQLPEVQPLIGYFSNTIAIRADLRGRLSFRECVRQVRATCLDVFDHADTPYERLVEALLPPKDSPHNPVFQTVFVFNDLNVGAFGGPELETTELAVKHRHFQFNAEQLRQDAEIGDLALHLRHDRMGALSGFLEYNAELFDPSFAKNLVTDLRTLLAVAVAHPDCRHRLLVDVK